MAIVIEITMVIAMLRESGDNNDGEIDGKDGVE